MVTASPQVNRVFQALADPTRRAVLERLGRGPVAMSDLHRPFSMALPSFSQHLDVLETCGLVRSHKTGRVPHLPSRAQAAGAGRALDDPPAFDLGAPSRPARCLPHDPEGAFAMSLFPTYRPDPKLDLVLERVVDVPARTGLEGVDHARDADAVVHTRAMDDARSRGRPAAGRHLPQRDGVARRHEDDERRQLPRGRAQRAPRLDHGALARLPAGPAAHRVPAFHGRDPPRAAGQRHQVHRRRDASDRRRPASSTSRWGSTTAGAPRSTSWWRSSRQAEIFSAAWARPPSATRRTLRDRSPSPSS